MPPNMCGSPFLQGATQNTAATFFPMYLATAEQLGSNRLRLSLFVTFNGAVRVRVVDICQAFVNASGNVVRSTSQQDVTDCCASPPMFRAWRHAYRSACDARYTKSPPQLAEAAA